MSQEKPMAPEEQHMRLTSDLPMFTCTHAHLTEIIKESLKNRIKLFLSPFPLCEHTITVTLNSTHTLYLPFILTTRNLESVWLGTQGEGSLYITLLIFLFQYHLIAASWHSQ